MNFYCPKCNKVGSVDDSAVPVVGIYAICSGCSTKFLIKPDRTSDFVFEPVENKLEQNIPNESNGNKFDNINHNSGDRVRLYRAAIGGNSKYYIPIFERFDKGLRTPFSWNWSACFGGWLWCWYRKMNKVGTYYFFLAIFASLMGKSDGIGLFIEIFICFSAAILFGIYSNWLYYKHINKIINNVKGITDENEIVLYLQQNYKTAKWVPYSVATIAVICTVIGIIAAILIPKFSENKGRSNLESSTPTQLVPYTGSKDDSSNQDVVTDARTGLMWTRNGNIAGKQMDWNDVMKWVDDLNHAGYNDWRIPTQDEIKEFMKRGENRPSSWFNANGFYNVQPSFYWSSSAIGNVSFEIVNMNNGDVGYGGKDTKSYVWPVRGEALMQ